MEESSQRWSSHLSVELRAPGLERNVVYLGWWILIGRPWQQSRRFCVTIMICTFKSDGIRDWSYAQVNAHYLHFDERLGVQYVRFGLLRGTGFSISYAPACTSNPDSRSWSRDL